MTGFAATIGALAVGGNRVPDETSRLLQWSDRFAPLAIRAATSSNTAFRRENADKLHA